MKEKRLQKGPQQLQSIFSAGSAGLHLSFQLLQTYGVPIRQIKGTGYPSGTDYFVISFVILGYSKYKIPDQTSYFSFVFSGLYCNYKAVVTVTAIL